jgi:polysaccharide chain length determinant protein (PEP-CTERM system associated)
MARDILSASNERSLVSRTTDIFRRRKIVVLLVFAAVIASAASFAHYLPDLYRTSATVLVERPVPETYVRSAVSGEVESRMHVIKQEVLSRARLTELIERFNLYPELRKREPMDTVLDQMRHDIEIEPNGPEQLSGRKTTVSFKLSYTGARDDAVADVTNALALFYVSRNEGIRSQDATRLTEFLKAQLDATKKQMERDEGAMRAYTSQHPGELPSQVDLNLHAIDRLNTQLRLNGERQLKLLEDREKVMEPQTATVDARTGEVVPSSGSDLIGDRIEALKKDLELLEGKGFTGRHPDVVRLKTEIATLQRDRQDSLVRQKESGDAPPASAAVPAATSGAAGGPSAATTAGATAAAAPTVAVPARRRLLQAMDAEMAKLKGDEAGLREQISSIEKRLESAPAREQEYERIRRDYSATKDLYDSLLKRYDDAQLGESMENDKQGERFRILETALPPSGPIAPNRPRLMIIGLLFAIAAAGVAALVAEQFDATFHSIDDVREFTTVPVLAAIPNIAPGHGRRAFKFVLATASLILVVAIVGALSAHAARGNEQIVWLLARAA